MTWKKSNIYFLGVLGKVKIFSSVLFRHINSSTFRHSLLINLLRNSILEIAFSKVFFFIPIRYLSIKFVFLQVLLLEAALPAIRRRQWMCHCLPRLFHPQCRILSTFQRAPQRLGLVLQQLHCLHCPDGFALLTTQSHMKFQ